VSYPSHLFPDTLQNIAIRFPDDNFMLQDVSITIHSRLSVHAVKSTFTVEEDAEAFTCTITDETTPNHVLTLKIPQHISESFTLALKRSVVRKSETLHVLFSYSVRTGAGSILYCTVRHIFTLANIAVVVRTPCSNCRYDTTNQKRFCSAFSF